MQEGNSRLEKAVASSSVLQCRGCQITQLFLQVLFLPTPTQVSNKSLKDQRVFFVFLFFFNLGSLSCF